MLIKRLFDLSVALGESASAFLFGARGVGKTYLCKAYLKELEGQNRDILTYDLLKTDTYLRLLKQPHLFRLEVEQRLKSSQSLFVFIDEIQKIPALLDEVQYLYQNYENQLQFLLSGSSARKLKNSGANLLAGRLLSLKLHPLVWSECNHDIFKLVQVGSLPGVLIDNEFPEQTLRSYVSTYLKEEIQQEALVRRVDAFARFLEVVAQYHCKILNASNIAKYAGVSSQTISDYLSILEDTLIAWRLPGWSASTTKQLRTLPKLYLFDNGVVNALRGEINSEVKESSSRFGDLFEAYVIQEILRANDYYQLDFKFSYWRTNNSTEVDVIISRGASKPIAAIEIKSCLDPENKDLKSLRSFLDSYPGTPIYCVCRAPRRYQINGIDIIPFKELTHLLQKEL